MKKIALILILSTISTLGISCTSNRFSTGDSALDKELIALQKEQNQYEKDTKKDMQSGIYKGVKYTIDDSYVAKFTVRNEEKNLLFVKVNMEPIKGNDNPYYYRSYPELNINNKGEKLRVYSANYLTCNTNTGVEITNNIRYYIYELPSDYIGYDGLTISIYDNVYSDKLNIDSSKFPTQILSKEEMDKVFLKDVEDNINEQKKCKTNKVDIEIINVEKDTKEENLDSTNVTIRVKNNGNLPIKSYGVEGVNFIQQIIYKPGVKMIGRDFIETITLNPGEEIELSFSFRLSKNEEYDKRTDKKLVFKIFDTNFIVDEV